MPIPLHPVRLREREFNQSQLLCESLCGKFRITTQDNNLVRIRNHRRQVGLRDYSRRFENIKGAFALRDSRQIKGKNVLLVDDVLTSGATCSEAARVLKQNGAGNVFVLTVASTK